MVMQLSRAAFKLHSNDILSLFGSLLGTAENEWVWVLGLVHWCFLNQCLGGNASLAGTPANLDPRTPVMQILMALEEELSR